MAGFTDATKSQHKLRVALDGPTGSGKTLTALIIARVLAGDQPFGVIDTERGAASLYAGLEIDGLTLNFQRYELNAYSPDAYMKAMDDAVSAGFPVLVIDSITHEWNGRGGILEIVEDEQRRRKQQSSYQSWAVGKREHRKFIDAMLATPYHLIVTMRSKMEHVLQENNGRKEVKKVGMEPVQSDDMQYEFDIVGDMDLEHNLVVTKTRMFEIADLVLKKPGQSFAKQILAWAESGTVPPPPPVEQSPERSKEQVAKIISAWALLTARAQEVGVTIPHPVDLSKSDAALRGEYEIWKDEVEAAEAARAGVPANE